MASKTRVRGCQSGFCPHCIESLIAVAVAFLQDFLFPLVLLALPFVLLTLLVICKKYHQRLLLTKTISSRLVEGPNMGAGGGNTIKSVQERGREGSVGRYQEKHFYPKRNR